MSRVSNNPVLVPKNVEVSITPSEVIIKGPLGSLKQRLESNVSVEFDDSQIKIIAKDATKFSNAISGTTRALVANMVKGVSGGFEKKLLLVGVGYRAQATASMLNLTLGFSHPVDYIVPNGIKIETPSQTEILIKGIDKQKVGQTAAEIRAYRRPEPYKGKGIRYSDEIIVIKETKKK
ncbi:large subunit ribosomal protein L6 [Nitrosomonas sp. PY1]|uniref:50S ribosomal protein L6 n=1 Tax=Nitrosomonas sp. PY1 TaxID=1803906 RepID=UPI001FC835B7|nr:50S ribosomal protein L6 [Nitrosomonas sp. PY1]GKS68818.1 large subunit ribosomal protein L6 [Nitrosomonas sp. PY1]